MSSFAKSYTNELLEQILLALGGGAPAGSTFNNVRISENAGTGITTTIPGSTAHRIDITVTQGQCTISDGTNTVTVSEGFSTAFQATGLITETIQIENDPAISTTVIITQNY